MEKRSNILLILLMIHWKSIVKAADYQLKKWLKVCVPNCHLSRPFPFTINTVTLTVMSSPPLLLRTSRGCCLRYVSAIDQAAHHLSVHCKMWHHMPSPITPTFTQTSIFGPALFFLVHSQSSSHLLSDHLCGISSHTLCVNPVAMQKLSNTLVGARKPFLLEGNNAVQLSVPRGELTRKNG